MMKDNILRWCDDKISFLKKHNVKFINGIPQLPESCIYKDKPKALSTFAFKKDIPEEAKKDGLLVFYMFEDKLWVRLSNIDTDIQVMKEYAGIAGFDLSPSITMLRPRQVLSIMINAIYSCYCGVNGIKILPNFRAGDFGTLCRADFFPDDCSFIVGNLGCSKNGFKNYGEYQLDIILPKKKPKILFVYGSLSKAEAVRLITKYDFDIIKFPDRRNRIRNNSGTLFFHMTDSGVKVDKYEDLTKGGVA